MKHVVEPGEFQIMAGPSSASAQVTTSLTEALELASPLEP